MATFTTAALERQHLLVLTDPRKPDFHMTRLFLHGYISGKQAKVEIYDSIKLAWGNLSKKRLQALELTRPKQVKVAADGSLSTQQIQSWVAEAKHCHANMLADWVLTVKLTGGAMKANEVCGVQVAASPSSAARARCEVCNKPRPAAEMKQRNGHEQVCRTCCKLLKQGGIHTGC